MSNKIFTLTLASLLALSFVSCEKLLETKPTDSIDIEGALDTKELLEAGTYGVYSHLRSTSLFGEEFIVYPEIQADNAVQSGRTTNLVDVANNVVNANMGGWQVGYRGIMQANIVLDALDKFDGPKQWKDNLKGQLYFLRALYYHSVSRVYSYDPTATTADERGAIPLILNAVQSIDDIDRRPRASIPEMYAHIYSDLDSAYALLANSDNIVAPHFATQAAVAALYTRVALYNGDYRTVVEYADKVLASGVATFSTKESYVSDWRKAVHPESLFEIVFTAQDNIGVNTSVHSRYMTRASVIDPEALRGNGYAVVSDDLFNAYDENDVRKELIWKGLGYNSDKNEMTKFFSRNGIIHLDNIPVIRLSEVILNRAEAYAHIAGGEAQSMDDVNMIRERAGLAPVSGLSEDLLMDEIVAQRRLELAFEGDRWFTLKRLGMDIPKPNGTIIPFSDFRILSRIPVRERNTTRGQLEQNKGY